ncbi:MAG TPA: Ig-like domain-containing protein, partial [Janthinobacterium sp.]|nr:Ig-like domain-containing protein [Janthinobacterium sp.]
MHALKRYTKILFCSAGLLVAALLAGCGGSDQGLAPILGLSAANVVSLTVTPGAAGAAAGATQQFAATAKYSDGTTSDVSVGAVWTSAAPAVASVNAGSGLASAIASGSAVISAAFGGQSASATLTVNATLKSIALLPPNPRIGTGASQQFIAMGSFSDGSVRDITTGTGFTSAAPAIARIGAATGLAVGLTAGPSLITATSGALSASTTLTVSPAVLVSIALTPVNPTLQIGAVRQLAVTATYSDASTGDVTQSSVFSSAAPGVASVGASSGLATGISLGSTLVSASSGGQTASTTITVSDVTLASLAVTPANATIAVGATQQFVATASYSDNTTAIVSNSVTWSSSATSHATIAAGGLASGIASGNAAINADFGGKTGTAALTVVAASVPPVAATLNLGRAADFGVLAGTSITNNSGGTTLITGDVGSPSQTTAPTVAAGFVDLQSGAVLDGALADLQVAITDANGRTCDVSFPSGIDLGGLTLAPGVYCYAGAISITGTLTLNGPGLYIFRTGLTLNSTANSVVALNNGATAANVFW